MSYVKCVQPWTWFLESNNVEVLSLTCDGTKTNLKTAKTGGQFRSQRLETVLFYTSWIEGICDIRHMSHD